jgi:hypothetical protein
MFKFIHLQSFIKSIAAFKNQSRLSAFHNHAFRTFMQNWRESLRSSSHPGLRALGRKENTRYTGPSSDNLCQQKTNVIATNRLSGDRHTCASHLTRHKVHRIHFCSPIPLPTFVERIAPTRMTQFDYSSSGHPKIRWYFQHSPQWGVRSPAHGNPPIRLFSG